MLSVSEDEEHTRAHTLCWLFVVYTHAVRSAFTHTHTHALTLLYLVPLSFCTVQSVEVTRSKNTAGIPIRQREIKA